MREESGSSGAARSDLLARLLEIGLAALIVLSPLPRGSVREPALSALEIGAFALGLLWLARASVRPTSLPPRPARAGIAGLLLLGTIQVLPLGAGIVGAISPRAAAIRLDSLPPADALRGERALLGGDPARLDRPTALSVDPPATASALKTGAALAILLLVAATVAAERGASGIAFALLISAALQGLIGTLVVAEGSAARPGAGAWLASGTFVNKNHYAGLLAAALPGGLALVLARFRRLGARDRGVARILGGEGSRVLLLGLLAVVGLAGLLLSFSRAGIALGALAVVVTFAATGRRGLKTRLAAALVVLVLAAVPLLEIGAERLAASYGRVPLEFTGAGSRGRVWLDTVALSAAFPAAGTGFGAFAAAYPLHRSPDVRLLFTHAHNDPLEFLSEGGLPGILLLGLLLAPILALVGRGLLGRSGPLAAGLAAGLLAFLLHSLVDFNFHVPSNAATAAILAGALMGCAGSAADPRSRNEGKAIPPDGTPRLTLVAPPSSAGAAAARAGRSRAIFLGSLALLAAIAATALSDRAARVPLDAAGIAREAVTAAIDSGPAAPAVRAALTTLREEIGRRPLDAAARGAYAGLLLELAASPEERRAAAFHAARAAEISKVSVPVVETAVRVLARCGEAGRAVELLRSMFGYDPRSAAALQADLEPFVSPSVLVKALPDDPDAWAAWIERLRALGRAPEADARLDRAIVLWPRHVPLRTSAALRALAGQRWEEMRRLLPSSADLPREAAGAALFACRSRLRAAEGDLAGAVGDASEASRLAPDDPWIRLQAGISLETAGDAERARAQWERGLYGIVPSDGNRWIRSEILTRLARLEDRVGRPADALRAWRSVLDLDPAHAEARRRAEELAGP